MAFIPTPPSFHPLGHAPRYAANPLGFLDRMHQAHGDIFRFRIAHRHLTVIRHPEHIRQVLQEHHSDYKKSLAYRKLSLLLGQGLFTSEGDFWLRQRRLSAPAFHKDKIQQYFTYIQDQSALQAATWTTGKPVALRQSLTAFTLKIISRTLLNIDLSEGSNETIEQQLPSALHFLLHRVLRPINVPMSVPLPSHRNFRSSVHALYALIEQLIEERSKGELQHDLLSMLLQATDDEGKGMTHQQLADEILTFYLAGHETTAVALSWTFWLLQKHPECYEALKAEVRHSFSGQHADELMNMPYTRAVMQESMRLYSPVWVLGREALRPHTLTGDFAIRKGDSVIFSPYLVHRHPEFWSDPEAFRPERFLTNTEQHKFAYFPFGGGPRLCIGNNFAMMEMMCLLANVALRCNTLKCTSTAPEFDYSLTLRPDREMMFVMSS